MDFLGYKNKRVIVSGCFSGMGEATARLLVELGAQVHGIDYKETRLDLASFNQVDLRDPAAIDAAIARIGSPWYTGSAGSAVSGGSGGGGGG